MAKQQQRSVLSGKLADRIRKGFEQHKGDETEYSTFGDLPPMEGVAKLVDCKFATYEKGDMKGQPYFIASGVVVSPKMVGDVHVEGKRTMIMEPICDTPNRQSRKTVEDHIGWVLNEMRKLGADTKDATVDDLEAIAQSLVEADIYFSFRVWKGKPTPQYPDPRPTHSWDRRLPDYVPEGGGDDVVDETEEATPPSKPSKSSSVTSGQGKPTGKPSTPPAKPTSKPVTKKKKEPEPEFDEFGDLDSLGSKADAGDDDAQQRLTDLAVEKGFTTEDIDAASNWGEVVEMINGDGPTADDSSDEGETSEDESAPEVAPQEGEVWLYKPVNPKTKQPEKKAVECEVIAVNEDKRTVNLKPLSNPKVTYPGVSWDVIQEV